MAPENPHKQESSPLERGQTERPREQGDPGASRQDRVANIARNNNRLEATIAKPKDNNSKGDNKELSHQEFEAQFSFEEAQLANVREHTWHALDTKIKAMESVIRGDREEAEKRQRERGFFGRLWHKNDDKIYIDPITGQEQLTDDQKIQREQQKALDGLLAKRAELKREAYNGTPAQQLEWLKKFRVSIGLPPLTQDYMSYDEYEQARVRATMEEDRNIKINFEELRGNFEKTMEILKYAEMTLNGVDMATGIVASFVPYGTEVYCLTKELTYVSTGTKTPLEAAEDFIIADIAGHVGAGVGKVGNKIALRVGGKISVPAIMQTFGKSVGGRIMAELEKRAPAMALRFTKEVADKALPVLREIGKQISSGAVRGAVDGGTESGLRTARDMYHGKDKTWSNVLEDALGGAESGAIMGGVMGPVGAYLRKRVEMRKNPKAKIEKPILTKQDILALPETKQGRAMRIAVAQELLELPDGISPAQAKAVLDAHNVPMSGDKYSMAELRQKMDILEAGGFSRDQADMLLREGVCGTTASPSKPANNTAPTNPSKGPPPIPSKWRAGERIAGQQITLARGGKMPSKVDYEVVGPKTDDPSIIILKITSGQKPGTLIEVKVDDLNTIPKAPKPPSAPLRGINSLSMIPHTQMKAGDIVRLQKPGKSQSGNVIPVGIYEIVIMQDPKQPGVGMFTLKPLNPADQGANYSIDLAATTQYLFKPSESDLALLKSNGYKEPASPPSGPSNALPVTPAVTPRRIPPAPPSQPSTAPQNVPPSSPSKPATALPSQPAATPSNTAPKGPPPLPPSGPSSAVPSKPVAPNAAPTIKPNAAPVTPANKPSAAPIQAPTSIPEVKIRVGSLTLDKNTPLSILNITAGDIPKDWRSANSYPNIQKFTNSGKTHYQLNKTRLSGEPAGQFTAYSSPDGKMTIMEIQMKNGSKEYVLTINRLDEPPATPQPAARVAPMPSPQSAPTQQRSTPVQTPVAPQVQSKKVAPEAEAPQKKVATTNKVPTGPQTPEVRSKNFVKQYGNMDESQMKLRPDVENILKEYKAKGGFAVGHYLEGADKVDSYEWMDMRQGKGNKLQYKILNADSPADKGDLLGAKEMLSISKIKNENGIVSHAQVIEGGSNETAVQLTYIVSGVDYETNTINNGVRAPSIEAGSVGGRFTNLSGLKTNPQHDVHEDIMNLKRHSQPGGGRAGNQVGVSIVLPESQAKVLIEYFKSNPTAMRSFFLQGGEDLFLPHVPPPYEKWDQVRRPIVIREYEKDRRSAYKDTEVKK